MTGVDIVHVPYRTSVQALTDLMAGQVHVFFDLIPSSIPHIRAGRLRALAVTSAKPTDLLPGVPSIADTVPGFEISAWFGIGAPRGTPPAIIERLNRDITAVITEPRVKARLAELSAEVMTGTRRRIPPLHGGGDREVGQDGEVFRREGGLGEAIRPRDRHRRTIPD